MALTRARAIAGDASLRQRATDEIGRVIRLKRDPARVIADVLEMRMMVEEEKGGKGTWDLKQVPGGLLDIEFIVQALQLMHAADHPTIVSTDIPTALSGAAKAGVLPGTEADVLLPAYQFFSSLIQLLRLCVDEIFAPADAPAPLLKRLAEAGDMPDFRSLEAHLRVTETAVRASFERLIGRLPGGAAGS
jgi:glutamate-ammonia-ligase adenylyltransferase